RPSRLIRFVSLAYAPRQNVVHAQCWSEVFGRRLVSGPRHLSVGQSLVLPDRGRHAETCLCSPRSPYIAPASAIVVRAGFPIEKADTMRIRSADTSVALILSIGAVPAVAYALSVNIAVDAASPPP